MPKATLKSQKKKTATATKKPKPPKGPNPPAHIAKNITSQIAETEIQAEKETASTAGTGEESAAIILLKAEIARLCKERDEAVRAPQRPPRATTSSEEICPLVKPNGEAGGGKHGFNLLTAMGLNRNDKEQLAMYHAIQRSVRTFAIRANIDMTDDYKNISADKLSDIFKLVRKAHPYMTKKRFKADWASAEMLKQFLKNHRRHEVKEGRLEKRKDRIQSRAHVHGTGAQPRLALASLPNIDSNAMASGDEDNEDSEDESGEDMY